MKDCEITTQTPADGLRVIELDYHSDPRWEQFVRSVPEALIYHQTGWLEALEREYGRTCLILGCEDSEARLLAILPLMYTGGLPINLGTHHTKRRLSSLPRTPLAGPLSLDPRATAAVLREAMNRALSEPGVQLEIKSDMPALETFAKGLIYLPWRFTHVLDLPLAENDGLAADKKPANSFSQLKFGNSRNAARIKWSVNKAVKEGVQLRRAEDKRDLRAWYDIYLETQRRNVVPPRPYRFFEALWDSLASRGLTLLLAEQHRGGRKRLLAGSVFLQYGRTVFYAFNGCRREDFHLRPNDSIQFEAIRQACEGKFRVYDLGEVPAEREKLAEFKAKWGSKSMRMHRYYYPAPPGNTEKETQDRSRARQLAEGIWRRLPLGLTEKLGDWVYSRL